MHKEQRQRLIEKCEGALIVLSSYDAMQWSGDMTVPFRQEASFWWASGINEPGWKMIIDGSRGAKTTLVRPEQSDFQRIFDGSLSDEEAYALSGADAIIAARDFDRMLRQLARTHSVVQTIDMKHHYEFSANPAQAEMVAMLKRHFASVLDCSLQLHQLRAIKTPEEIRRIKKAVAVTTDAFAYVRKQLDTYRYEYEIEADFWSLFRRQNTTHAYEPIVASGHRACTLHYNANTARLSLRSAVLIDIGAYAEGYAADITRTYCLKPTKRQQAVHAALARAQTRCIAVLQPGLPVAEYIDKTDDIMKDALIELGLFSDKSDDEAFRRYFPHAISHGLGVDTHDPLGRPRYFQENMVLTVEPGIYIPEEKIGMRIEDDVLITANGAEVLSASLSTKL